MGVGGKEAQEGRDICIHIADSHWCTAETRCWKAIILQLKKKKIENQEFQFWCFLQKVKIELPCNPETPPKRIESRVSNIHIWVWYIWIRVYIHSSTIHNSQKVETTQIPINGWMDKQNVYTYNRKLFRLKRKGTECYDTNEPWQHSIKWNKPVTKGQILCDSTSRRSLE